MVWSMERAYAVFFLLRILSPPSDRPPTAFLIYINLQCVLFNFLRLLRLLLLHMRDISYFSKSGALSHAIQCDAPLLLLHHDDLSNLRIGCRIDINFDARASIPVGVASANMADHV